MTALLDITESSIELLEKAAQEADALEAVNTKLAARVKVLEQKNAELLKTASAPKVDSAKMMKFARVLEEEQLLVEGMTADKLASLLTSDPNQIADIALHILRPVAPQGVPTKAANNSQGNTNMVTFDGRQVVDNDGWVNVLRQ